MAGRLHVLSGGAAQGLVGQMQARLLADTGFAVEGTFGAVGAIRDKLLAGEPCDLVILTQQLIDQLAADGHVVAGSGVPLGVVRTGIAVKTGAAVPDVSSASALRAALLAADAVYLPDPVKATAGIHFMKVLTQLGVADTLAQRLRPFPNGATAMREMADAAEAVVIGCTQVTEIRYTGGVHLVGVLPQEFELATVYTAGICTKAREAQAADRFMRLLAGNEAQAVREAGGFEALPVR